jgi:acyl-[acyl-carrier-protein]-phospholipid O-acyltransferase/long-chain-fatty-acid--[acyl-carrier-protein] ligase
MRRWAKAAARLLLRVLFRVDVAGLEHYHAAGRRVLVVANHVSFMDAVLLDLFLPGALTFAIDPRIARVWWVRALLGFTHVLPVDPAAPLAIRELIRLLAKGRRVVIFPEGRITVTGSLMKIYQGPALVADRADASALPVRIAGPEYSPFSLLGGRVRRRWFPRVRLTVLPPRRLGIAREVRGRARRQEAARRLADVMADMIFATSDYRRTLAEALLAARRLHGGRHVIAEDAERRPLTYDALLARASVLARVVAGETRPGESVGVLVPTSVPALVTFVALQLAGRVPAMLNFTAGADGMLAACAAAGVRRVYTSREFVERARLGDAVRRLGEQATIVHLEDLRARITTAARIGGWLRARVAGRLGSAPRPGDPDAPAIVLFTAGTEGRPKGVVLSHAGVLANHAQVTARLDIGPRDVVLNALPLFHSFGLNTGALLPLLAGVKMFFVPSPLRYRLIAETAYDVNATILFGTDTFLAGYARVAHPYDFYRVRYVFAGAERLRAETRQAWAEKFGIRILEGYGATETGPVLATNTPVAYRPDTVGRLLPGVDAYVEPIEGLERGGRLCVGGPNVMLGYLRAERPGVLEPPRTDRGEGWYDTGDVVTLEGDGFVRILGRARRFAKIGAEMVSLAAVEELATRAWPGARHAALAVPDSRRGERIVLLTERRDARREELLARARTDGLGESHVPRLIVGTEAMPLLGAGKTDYTAARARVEHALAAAEVA